MATLETSLANFPQLRHGAAFVPGIRTAIAKRTALRHLKQIGRVARNGLEYSRLVAVKPRHRIEQPFGVRMLGVGKQLVYAGAFHFGAGINRSEEHTSEL